MDPQTPDPLLGTVIFVLAIASLSVWFVIFDRLKHGPILAYEPRRPAPWSGAVAIPAFFFAFAPLVARLTEIMHDWFSLAPTSEPKPPSLDEMIPNLALGMVFNVLVVGVAAFGTIIASGSKLSDLGLPQSIGGLFRDVRIGVIAWLGALIPVFGVNVAMNTIFGESDGHPLIHMVMEDCSLLLFALAFLAAVVQAPITEEIAFRLLLQGWLEKRESTLLDRQIRSTRLNEMTDLESSELPIESPDAAESEQPSTGAFGLPYGWFPIVVSSFLFAIAHFGYGPEPVPLFLLALILGYVYQRTHRIVPCIVTHALFNGMTLFTLWRLMSAGAE
jgi:membrane protease YdiL (CAAX protease family)